MEGNKMNTEVSQPLEWLAANDAVARCEKLESDLRNKGDYCHNNICDKTYDDWERMDKFLLDSADDMRKIRRCMEFLATVSSRQNPRNCDVGTAEEQTKRFSDFCAAHRHTDLPRCAGCPLENTPPDTGCSFAWGQMPYEEGDAK